MNRKPTRIRSTAAGLLVALTCATSAYAGPSAGAAKGPAAAHAKKAGIAYNLSDWKRAIKEYRAAYAAEQKASYLFGLAQAQRMSGDCKSAIASYKAFKRGNVTPNQATAAELLITKCQAKLEQEKAQQELAKAKAAKAKEKSPATSPPSTSKPRSKPAPAPVAAEKPTPWYEDTFGHVLFVAGAGATVAGAIFLVKGNSLESNTSGNYDDTLARQKDGKKNQVIGVAGLAVGGALIASAVLRYALVGNGEPSKPQHDQHASLYGFAGPHRAELGVTGRF